MIFLYYFFFHFGNFCILILYFFYYLFYKNFSILVCFCKVVNRFFLFQSAFKIYTRGVYNFSDVSNTNTYLTDAANNLVIDYEAFVVSVDGLTDGATHWVSAGIEYNNSYNVWIGQVSYTMKTAAPVSTG